MRSLQNESFQKSSYSWSYNTSTSESDELCEEVKLTTLDHRFDVLIRRAGDFCRFALRPHNQNTIEQEIECTNPQDAVANLKELGYRDGEKLIYFGLEFFGI